MDTSYNEKIEYHIERKRDSACPISHVCYDDDSYEACQKCDYFDNGHCHTTTYKTDLKKWSEDDEPDPYGGMPFTDYYWEFPCSNCGKTIQYSSGMSAIDHHTMIRCKQCDTPHVLIKGGYSSAVFLIPAQQNKKETGGKKMSILLEIDIDEETKEELKKNNEYSNEALQNIIDQQLVDFATVKKVQIEND